MARRGPNRPYMGTAQSCCNADGEPAKGRVAQDESHHIMSDRSHSLEASVTMADKGVRSWARGTVFASSASRGGTKKDLTKTKKQLGDVTLVRTAVAENTLLGAILAPQLENMIEYMDEIRLKTGTAIDLSGGMSVVLDGKIELQDGYGRTIAHTKGAVLGDVGLLHGKCTGEDLGGARAVASNTRVFMLKRGVYREMMEYSRQQQLTTHLKLLSSIPLFKKLSVPEKLQLADACAVEIFESGQTIMRQGEVGEHFYILKAGEAEVLRKSGDGATKRIDYLYQGDHFGEVALTKDQPRYATVVAAEGSKRTEALRVDRSTFMQLLGPIRDVLDRTDQACRALDAFAVPLFAELTAECRSEIVKRLKQEEFANGKIVFKQGDIGTRLYIIKDGEVSIQVVEKQDGAAHRLRVQGTGREIDHLYRGQYFGERALLKDEPRMASAVAKGRLVCYSLAKSDFQALALNDNFCWSRRWEKEDTRDTSQLEPVKVMGQGAFGVAWLVQHREHGERKYALKVLDKKTVQKHNWRTVVVREKNILASLPPHPNVIALYQTFQDDKALFMLMELAPGGELYQLLSAKGKFEPAAARFFCGNVVLALGHLHHHSIIFRDLKPENLLVAANGYLKLIDMGFAKRVAPGAQTYTLCGTPYYLAPEMIKHKGHDKAVDWWTLGVLTYEMMDGEPPFNGSSEIEVYSKITRLQYTCPSHFPADAVDLIRKLLNPKPEQRIGNLHHSTGDVQAQPWFHSFDFDQLHDMRLPAPYIPDTGGADASKPKDTLSTKKKRETLDFCNVISNSGDKGFWQGW